MKVEYCKECGFKHQDPLPSKKELDKYYKEKYTQESWTPKLDLKQREYLLFHAKEVYNIINNNLHPTLPKTILDIGCGDGHLLRVFKKEGWEIKGIEPNKKININTDLDIFKGNLDEYINLGVKKKYSVVNISEVLEHCRRPKEILEKVKELMLPHGALFIEIANDFSILQELVDKKKREYWVCKEHINYFNLKSLTYLLDNCGFKIKYSTVLFPIELGLLMGFNYLEDKEAGRDFHNMQFTMEKELEATKKGRDFKEKLYNCFKDLGIGRTILCYVELKQEVDAQK